MAAGMQATSQCLSDMVPAGLEQQLGLGPRPETAGMPVVACVAADDGPMPIRRNIRGGSSQVNSGNRNSSGTEDRWEPAGQVLDLVGAEAT